MSHMRLWAAFLWFIFLADVLKFVDSSFHERPFQWDAMPELHNSSYSSPSITSLISDEANDKTKRPFASKILGGQSLYVSLTTIHNRIYGIMTTIESIIGGTVWPDHIYVFVSRDPHLLDMGVTPEFILTESKGKLKEITAIYPWISVIFTENIGPHRKLLPLLAKKWDEDCAIVTVDDHETYKKTTLESLIKYYEASGRNAVVALRARRMGICSDAPPWRVAPYTKNRKGLWPEASPAYREMLILPTGTGGVLYRPKFFHPVVFDRRLINATVTGDDLMFRLATLAMGVPVVTACAERDALGKKCPAKIPLLRMSNQFPSMVPFTFSMNYSADALQGDFHSPGVQSAFKTASPDNRKKHRNRKKNRHNSPTNEVALSVLSSANGARVRNLKKQNHLRILDESSVEWKNDPRKIESLATRFNTGGGNNMMWDRSLDFLEEMKVLDFNLLLQYFAPLERSHCLLSASIVSKKKGEEQKGLINHLVTRIKIALQTSYSQQCGLCICDYKNKSNNQMKNHHKNQQSEQ